MIILETQGLTHQYSVGSMLQHTAITDVNIQIYAGEFIGIIGHTGSGKSTLIQHFNGLLQPTEGRVLLAGKDIWASKESIRAARFRVGLCFQYPEYQLFEDTVAKDIAFGPKNMKLEQTEIDRRVQEAAAHVGLTPALLEKSPFDLSGGEKRRAAIAGVMSMEPEVLILDEPTAGLDPKGRSRILQLVKQYQKETGSTVLLVSHNMEDIATLADRVLVLNQSKVAMFDEVDAVFRQTELLREMGLNIPEITQIMLQLQESGFPALPTNIYTIQQARDAILQLWKGGDGHGA